MSNLIKKSWKVSTVQGPCARATKRDARASGFSKTLNHVVSTIRLRILFHWSARTTTIGTRPFMSCGPCTHLRPLRLFSWHFHINKRPLHPTLSTRFVALSQGPCTSFRVRKTKIRYSKSIRKTVYRKNRLTITWNQQFDIICWLRSHIHSKFSIVISEIDRWTCFCNIPCHYWTIGWTSSERITTKF